MKSKKITKRLPDFFGVVAKRLSSHGDGAEIQAPTPECGSADVDHAVRPFVAAPDAVVSTSTLTTQHLESLVTKLKKDLAECDAQRLAAEERIQKSAIKVAHMRAELERLRPMHERLTVANKKIADLEEALQDQTRIVWVKEKMIEELMKPQHKKRRSKLLMATRKHS